MPRKPRSEGLRQPREVPTWVPTRVPPSSRAVCLFAHQVRTVQLISSLCTFQEVVAPCTHVVDPVCTLCRTTHPSVRSSGSRSTLDDRSLASTRQDTHKSSAITIRALNPGQVLLDGQNARRVIYIASGNVVLEGLGITGGSTSHVRAFRLTRLHCNGLSWSPPPWFVR